MLILIALFSLATSDDNKKASTSSATICNKAGIGDTLSDFNNAYGKSKDEGGMISYKDQTIQVITQDKKAWNITTRFNSSDWLPIDSAKDFLPKDMEIIKQYDEDQYNDGNIRRIYIGESESLKSAFPKDAGKFIVFQRVYLSKSTESYNSFVIASGDTP